AICGLFRALSLVGTIDRDVCKQTMGKNLLLILLIDLAFGVLIPQIDMGAHLGGLIGGYIASAIVFVPQKRRLFIQIAALVVYLLLFLLLGYYGINMNLSVLEDLLP